MRRNSICVERKPVIKMVPPLRKTALNNFENDIKNGKYQLKHLPNLREIAISRLSSYDEQVIIPSSVFRRKMSEFSLHENPYFKNAYEAMKQGSQDIKEDVTH